MNANQLFAIAPLIVLMAGTVIIMLVIAFRRSHPLTAGLTLAALVLALISIPITISIPAGNTVPGSSAAAGAVTPLLVMDGYARFIMGLILAASLVVTLLAYGYLRIHTERHEEFYLLLLTAALGGCVLAASSHFASFFLGLEILSISLYALIGYTYDNSTSVEAAVKYLVLAAASAAFLLFGMALVYAQTGTMEFAGIARWIGSPGAGRSPAFLLTGLMLVLVGFGYKLALVPFHLWTPDVYEGSPAPVTAFVATVSKGSMFAVLVRFFSQVDPQGFPSLFVALVVISVVTMLAGNILALLQNNLKRILAYSSIANLGYLLVAFLAGGTTGVIASTFYLVSYFITILAAFGVVSALSVGSRDSGWLDDYRGLMWSRPGLAVLLTASMFSLAGLPLTVGFIGKFYLALAGVGAALWLLVFTLVISSAISLYYYLRVVVVMYNRPAQEFEAEKLAPAMTPASGLALAGLLLLVVGLGVYPAPLLNLIQGMVRGLY